MKNHTLPLKIAALVLALLCVVPLSGYLRPTVAEGSTLSDIEKQIDKLEDDIAAAKAKMNDLKKKLNSLSGDVADAKEQKAYFDELEQITAGRIANMQALNAELDAQMEAIAAAVAEAETQKNKTYGAFLDRVRASYEEGSASYLELLFGAASISDFASRWDYVSALLRNDRKTLEKYRADKQTLEVQQRELEATKNKQLVSMSALEELELEYEQMKADAEAYLAELKKKQSDLENQISNYSEGLDEINKELEEMLRKRAEMQEKTYIAEAELLWPVSLKYRTISSYYGPRTYTYNGKKISDNHIGIDITGSGINKTPIYAVADGEVITAKEHSSYGNYIIIDHGSGITTLYAHANKLYVKKGDVVKAGDKIAEVGTTGQTTGPHLHFEIRVAGKTVNPLEQVDSKGNKHPYVVQPKK